MSIKGLAYCLAIHKICTNTMLMMRCLVQWENRDQSAAGRDLRAGDDAKVQVDIGKEESVERK